MFLPAKSPAYEHITKLIAVLFYAVQKNRANIWKLRSTFCIFALNIQQQTTDTWFSIIFGLLFSYSRLS